ncbi:MAG: glutamate--tRNA ligase [Candidatus Dormibacteria bacterium]
MGTGEGGPLAQRGDVSGPEEMAARTPMRTRFGPSTTGALHLGSMRTALFAWLAARSTGGTFLLRIEDTDQARRVTGSEIQILESLRWLGLDWDEGPEVEGGHGPYVQSLRTSMYLDHALELVRRGAAYWCTCTAERLALMRAEQRAASQPTRYDRRCAGRREEVDAERARGAPAVLRQRMPEGRTTWEDVIRGKVDFDNADIDDSVLIKADGYPTYHLAVVVDDHLMEITHVIRAEEWIPSTPKHLMLYAALDWPAPRFAHVPLVLDEQRHKLSKRRGARDVLDYRAEGYLPSALVNAMALLGWSSGTEDEVFTPDELCDRFSLERVAPSPAVLDSRRLRDLNGVHIRRLDPGQLAGHLRGVLPGANLETRRALVPLLQERITVLTDAIALTAPLLGDAPWQEGVLFPPPKVDGATTAELLRECIAGVEGGGLDDVVGLREQLTALLGSRGVKARDGFRVLYIAILGTPAGVPVFDAMRFVGKNITLSRLRAALDRLDAHPP